MNLASVDTESKAGGRVPRYLRMVLVTAACMIGLAAALAPSAGAQMEITDFEAPMLDPGGEEVTQAGARPFEVVNVIRLAPHPVLPFGVSGSLKDVEVDMPVGFVGDPSEFPTCTVGALTAATCPSAAQIGVFILTSPFQTFQSEPVYNMDVPQGQPARFGARVAGGNANVFFDASVRPDDNGITVTSSNIAHIELVMVLGTELRLWGVPGDPAHDALRAGPAGTDRIPFLTTQTNCHTVPVTRMRARSWQDPSVWIEREHVSPPMQGCELLDLDGSVKVQPQVPQASSPSGYTVEVTQKVEDSPDALATAHLKDAVVKLPAGVAVNPSAADGLVGCTEAQMGLGKAGEPACPAASKIGEVRIDTPTLDEPLVGPIYQAAQGANPFGSLLALYMAPKSDRYGVRIKLAGEVKADPVTGQLTTSFLDNPQQPFTKLTMSLKGGSRAVLVNPPTCGSHVTEWSMTSHARPNLQVTGSDSFQITSGPGGGTCPSGPQPFSPAFEAGAVSPIAGAFSPLAVRLLRGDGQQQVTGLSVKLPQGMIGRLAGVPYCPDAVLNRFPAGTNTPLGTATGEIASPACPAASQVGTVTVGAGAGSTPFYLETGRAYLAGPYKGAPLSLAVVMPVKAGPFDLGTVMVRNAIHVDRSTAQLTVVSDPLPTILEGIPLRIRDLRVEVDRDRFAFTPTDCTASAVEAILTGDQGGHAGLANRFQVADCARLGFAPKLGLRLTGKRQVRTGRHPGVRAVVRPGGVGSAGIRGARVVLPKALALDPDNAGALCEFAEGTADDPENRCPKGSIVGRARVVTPLLDEPLVGNVYFVKNVRVDKRTGYEIRTLPMIVIALRGQIAINLHGVSSTTRKGRLVSTFAGVPDAPIARFNLNIRGGGNGILTVTRTRKAKIDLCAKPKSHTADTRFRGHNGRSSNPKVQVRTPCAKRSKAKRKTLRLRRAATAGRGRS